jgi:phosphotransferase system enzyme I (PtsI)
MASKSEKVFRGSGVSPGVVLGQALKLDSHNRVILKIHVHNVDEEIRRFYRAIEKSKEQLKALRSRLEEKAGSEHSFIMDAHLLMLEDKTLIAEILSSIKDSRVNAEWAVSRASDRLVKAYESLEDEYFRERHSDIENVVERIMFNLTGQRPFSWDPLPEDLIIVSRGFNPSNFATMDIQKVRGLVLESGGRTSHTAIISRGLGLPAVMGIRDFLPSVITGDTLLLDADEGQVIVNPTAERMENFRGRIEAFDGRAEFAPAETGWSTHTLDGTSVSLLANTELPYESIAAKRSGAEGIGLFRSEILFFGHPHGFPSMEEQLSIYRALVREMRPLPVAVRTLDTGYEKVWDGAPAGNHMNPSIGLRGIRLSLELKELFCTQIEAILRASREGMIEVVLPMISTVEEIWQAKELIDQVRSRLLETPGFLLNPMPIGVMIEVPAAVLMLEVLAKEVDFLCVGTNDLIQYTLAADRGNPQVSHLYQPLHPSVLHSLFRIAEVARRMGKPVRICGETSSNPFFAVLLLGLGFTQLSMNPVSIPTIRSVLHEVPMEASKRIASKALTFATAKEVHQYLTDVVSKLIQLDLTAHAREIDPAAIPQQKSV